MDELTQAACDHLQKLVTDAEPGVILLPLDYRAMRRVLAAIAGCRDSVRLPEIRDTDDLAHWRGLDDQNLRNEIAADLWNAAAGLHIQAQRQQTERDRLAADAARFSGRTP